MDLGKWQILTLQDALPTLEGVSSRPVRRIVLLGC